MVARICPLCGRPHGIRSGYGRFYNPVIDLIENVASAQGCICRVQDEVLVRLFNDAEGRSERWKAESFPDGLPVKGSERWPEWVSVQRTMDGLRELMRNRGISASQEKKA